MEGHLAEPKISNNGNEYLLDVEEELFSRLLHDGLQERERIIIGRSGESSILRHVIDVKLHLDGPIIACITNNKTQQSIHQQSPKIKEGAGSVVKSVAARWHSAPSRSSGHRGSRFN